MEREEEQGAESKLLIFNYNIKHLDNKTKLVLMLKNK